MGVLFAAEPVTVKLAGDTTTELGKVVVEVLTRHCRAIPNTFAQDQIVLPEEITQENLDMLASFVHELQNTARSRTLKDPELIGHACREVLIYPHFDTMKCYDYLCQRNPEKVADHIITLLTMTHQLSLVRLTHDLQAWLESTMYTDVSDETIRDCLLRKRDHLQDQSIIPPCNAVKKVRVSMSAHPHGRESHAKLPHARPSAAGQ